MRTLLTGLLCSIFCSLGAVADPLSLTNNKGVTIEAELVERGEKSAKVKMNGKTFTIPYDQLTKDSVELIKKTKIEAPTSDKLEIDVRMKKSGEIKKSGRVTTDRLGYVTDTTGSFRIDTVTGTITLANRHSDYPTKAGTMRVAVLKKGDAGISVMHQQDYTLSALRPLTQQDFEVDPSKSQHSAKGTASLSPSSAGRYVGYIVAVYEGEKIVTIKSVPAIYETDRLSAVKLLGSKK